MKYTDIKLSIDKDPKKELSKIAKSDEITIIRKSLDARRGKTFSFVYSFLTEKEEFPNPMPDKSKFGKRPVVIGFGPAGMFASLLLARAGAKPITIERGGKVEDRTESVKQFWNYGKLDTESNVQFGEGGAGTFSDGKLTTLIKEKDGLGRFVLKEFVKAGAPEEIMYEAKPHIGTDVLKKVVKNIREEILSLSGEILFNTKAEDILIENGKVTAVITNTGKNIETDHVFLGIGHSARDTFKMLREKGIAMERKPFSVGVRIEHLQSEIDKAQYREYAGSPYLSAADYKLSSTGEGKRGVYTFCMCPGGQVVAAASEEGRLVTNGMSNYARDGVNANSAVLVGITPDDFGSHDILSGCEFQRRIEEAAFRAGGENYRAPVQLLGDFLSEKNSSDFGRVQPSYMPGTNFAKMDDILPTFVTDAMKNAFSDFSKKLPGFDAYDAVLTGVESRSSSPVRILRDKETGESISVKGLYPMGEGAGYAGGIMSAAIDGIKSVC